ncbi:HAD family hydrolase [Haloactinopolyspora alba]|nr:HAD-IA family hydrolase [Haloactinopolyspora alba]
MSTHSATLYLDRIDAIVFDTDGVVTDTAREHAAAWKQTFDAFLLRHAKGTGEQPTVFDAHTDYLRYVDGRPRDEGVRSYLASLGITLPETGGRDSIAALAEEKTQRFAAEINRHGVIAFPSSVDLLRELRQLGVPTAVVSSSRHCRDVLRAANVVDLFSVRVDGFDMERLGIKAKPEPGLFVEAAARLGVPVGRCAIIEDSLTGVEAGRRGAFGVVIGVDRHGDVCGEMYEHGAHVVVSSLADISLVNPPQRGASAPEGTTRTSSASTNANR